MTTATVPHTVTWTLNDMVATGTISASDALSMLADMQLERRRAQRQFVPAEEAVAA